MFERLEMIPPDPILTLNQIFNQDNHPHKIDLGIGLYKNDSGTTPIMECVKLAEKHVVHSSKDKIYKGSNGLDSFCENLIEMLFQTNIDLKESGRVSAFQTIGGTGAVRLSAEIVHRININTEIWISNPSWDNHKDIFEHVGLKVNFYPYKSSFGDFNYQNMIECIRKIPQGSIIILHGCGHNPTGFDLTHDQWIEVITLIKELNLLPIIDMAYHGLAKGIAEDRKVIDILVNFVDEFFVTYSCSKNFGLYRDRVGALIIFCKDRKSTAKIKSQLSRLTRLNISTPAAHGALIVNQILSSKELKSLWEDEITHMNTRIKATRCMLIEAGKKHNTQYIFDNIYNGVGLFSMLELTPVDVELLRNEFGIYLLESGRINVSGLNHDNVTYFVSSIKSLKK
ncbi:aromatic amino acid transaminase [Marinomonas posidonica]|uniref:Aminotransferase n=1 Tax=Marinomonas posidonica (strain CECT 7376 / NCIMB 14433 / IVIA-Po-181) TaxID=491952 RepID=F6CSV3_MARPP|nr:aromatic amino acid transaminase [Marinomonas posidonica]AEF53943.1 Aspartate transaminase [Marinomonas posidonica IVIA-Po-181]